MNINANEITFQGRFDQPRESRSRTPESKTKKKFDMERRKNSQSVCGAKKKRGYSQQVLVSIIRQLVQDMKQTKQTKDILAGLATPEERRIVLELMQFGKDKTEEGLETAQQIPARGDSATQKSGRSRKTWEEHSNERKPLGKNASSPANKVPNGPSTKTPAFKRFDEDTLVQESQSANASREHLAPNSRIYVPPLDLAAKREARPVHRAQPSLKKSVPEN